jgi:tetratricopeptide (TPR) repeat protein
MKQDKHTARDLRAELFLSAALALLTLLVYWPTFSFPFVDYDDPHYVFNNPHVQSGLTADNIRWAFTTFDCGNWHPLTWLSLQLDATLFGGQKAGGFHATNVLLHTANTVLLFLILVRLTGGVGPSAMAAGLFALHPLHVESVAWVTERKDVLSTLFWLLAMAAYLFYVNRPSVRRYLLLLVALGLGLLAKAMLVTLPCVLLLLDYWPLRRWSRVNFRYLLLEKMPLFALVVATCVLTFQAQLHGKSVAPFEGVPLGARLGNALLAYTSYLGKMIWPAHLAVYYPHPRADLPWAWATAAGLLLAVITLLVFGPGRRWPYLAVGWLWYLGTLVPVIGLVQVGGQSMADRYTYVPMIGLLLMLSCGAADLARAWRLPRSYLTAAGVLVLAACAALTRNQLDAWKSTRHLWAHTAAATKNNIMAYINLGVCYSDEKKFLDAKQAFEKAATIDPRLAEPRINLGSVYAELGLWERAAAEFRAGIDLNPQQAPSYYNLGNALAHLGQREEAVAAYRRAIELNPHDPVPYINLGIQLDYLGRLEEAESVLRKGIEVDPSNAQIHSNLGILLVELDRQEEALTEFRKAIALDPNDLRFHSQLAGILQEEGQLDEALAENRTALERGDMQAEPRIVACEHLLALRPRLAGLIAGRDQPANNHERLAFAELCMQRRQRRYALAARLYREAFRDEPRLADDSRSGHRYHAAAAAAAAGCGQDAAPLDEKEMANLRHQALEWLQAELDLFTRSIQNTRPEVLAAAGRTLRMWQRNAHFAGVRDPALAQRPQTEQQAWRKLWSEVTAILSKADAPRTKQAGSARDR